MIINSARNPIIILDFGSQYTQLIARRIRELGVYCEIYPNDVSYARLEKLAPCGIILSGGPATVVYKHNPRAPDWVFKSQLPVLGICYGMQLMAAQLGGKVIPSAKREFGYAKVTVTRKSFLLDQIFDKKLDSHQEILDVWMSHGDKVTQLPPEFDVIGTTDNTAIAAMAHRSRHWYGVQFHPEVTHTTQGMRILEKFVMNICHAPANWTPSSIIKNTLEKIYRTVGKDKVLLGLSGGVDSSVVALLLDKAIGKQLICVFVDTGLLRLNEAQEVIKEFESLDITIIAVDAEQKFIQALSGVTCPEKKRKIIGRLFIEVFEEQAKKLQGIKWLAQGTIYSDVIESAATTTNHAASVIKSHHNVGGLPERLNFKLIEPLRELFKDEVRKVGQALGLNPNLLKRHPFPGVGLGVRILGEVSKRYADILRKADAIFIEELKQNQLYDKVSQAFAVFLPVKSVGVVGDSRAYEYVICLRAVETVDFMTAVWAQLPWDFLSHVSNRIINEVAHVSRVTYDISGKPPATIEWE